jgi:hypothetical protein
MIITNLMTLVNQLKIYHWQTTSEAEHNAFGKAYDALNELTDTFMEVYMGKYGRRVAKTGFSIKLDNYTSGGPMNLLNKYEQYLASEVENEISPECTELLNIRDEMKAVLNKTKYLLTLK